MEHEKDSSKVAWNAAEGIIMEISNRRTMANTFFVQNNISKAFNALISIKQTVIQSFEQKDRDKLQDIETRFNKVSGSLASSYGNSFNPKLREAHKLARRIASKLYPEYNDLLMDLLQKKGYLVGQKSDSSKMKF